MFHRTYFQQSEFIYPKSASITAIWQFCGGSSALKGCVAKQCVLYWQEGVIDESVQRVAVRF
jgi:hypothetical protein